MKDLIFYDPTTKTPFKQKTQEQVANIRFKVSAPFADIDLSIEEGIMALNWVLKQDKYMRFFLCRFLDGIREIKQQETKKQERSTGYLEF